MGFESRKTERFKTLFHELYPRLAILTERLLNDEEQGKDIIQEAFISLWNMERNGETILSAKSYLYTTVRNMSLNYLRDSRKNSLLSVDDLEEQETVFKEVVIEEETLALLQAAIEKLPRRSSRIMKQVLSGKGNIEIAQEMKISVNTVKTLKYKAMKILKNELKEMYYFLVLLLDFPFLKCP